VSTAALPAPRPPTLALDAAGILVLSAAICVAARRLDLMTALVAAVLAARFAALAHRGLRALATEAVFLAGCALLGGSNDWNTVVRHGVYEYTVPSDLAWSSIPLWMLLYWGLVLRFLAALAASPWLGGREADDRVFLLGRVYTSAPLRLGLALGLVLATRQTIYRLFDHPILSWLPFALALAAYALLFRPGPGRRRLIALLLVGGPAVEALYIQLGGLHRYRLGWLGGVPLWIALWWTLAGLVWGDVAPRLERATTGGSRCGRGRSGPPPGTCRPGRGRSR
jgi:hypothetical protein